MSTRLMKLATVAACMPPLILFAVCGTAEALDLKIDTGGRAAGPLEVAGLLTLITLAPAILWS